MSTVLILGTFYEAYQNAMHLDEMKIENLVLMCLDFLHIAVVVGYAKSLKPLCRFPYQNIFKF